MEIPVTFLTVVEYGIVGVLSGMSTVAVILYAVNLRHKNQRNAATAAITAVTYTIIRLFHVLFAVLVALSLLIYGILDGIAEANIEYGVKAAALTINALVAYGMHKKFLPVMYAAPVVVAGWYFLAGYHIHTIYTVSSSVFVPIGWYLLVVLIMQGVFIALRAYVKPCPRNGTQASTM